MHVHTWKQRYTGSEKGSEHFAGGHVHTRTHVHTHVCTCTRVHTKSPKDTKFYGGRCTLTTADKCVCTHTYRHAHTLTHTKTQDTHARHDAWQSQAGKPTLLRHSRSGPFPTEARMAAWSLVRGPPARSSQMRHHLSSPESHQLSSLPSLLTSHLGHRRPRPLASSRLWPAFVEFPLPGRTVQTNGALSGSA